MTKLTMRCGGAAAVWMVAGLTAGWAVPAQAQDKPKEEFPPFAEVSKDYEKVVSTADGEQAFYTLWSRKKDGQMLAELPRGYEGKKQFIALTVAGGETYAGLQAGDMYVYWKRYDKKLALIEPNLGIRTTGDQESKSSVDRIFTDRVVLEVPIACLGPNGQPVIDMDALLVGQAGKFFGGSAAGINAGLATVAKAKAFPENIELAFEAPTGGGVFKTFHYSISKMPEGSGYKPRAADERIGFFTTNYVDLGKFTDQDKWVRYINRWQLEKADAKLKLSPPKQPIIFYVEHTTPIRYRRWVRDGTLYWNKAFEKCGIKDAVEVYFQDEATGAHMDKDPEDRRFNFIRWLSNDQGTAIGPSRVDPLTGQILDADIILTDGWIRHFWYEYKELMPELAMEGFSPETLAWLDKHPQWDPRVRMAPPGERDLILAQRAQRGVLAYGGHPIALTDRDPLMGKNEYDGLAGRRSQMNGLCMAGKGKALDMALMRMSMDVMDLLPEDPPQGGAGEPKKGDEPKKEEKGDLLDGVPDWYAGPALADLVAHEVGHTLGLRHNFRASGAYTMAQINSKEFKGQKTMTTSVMDYNPVNINMQDGEVQGDFCMIDVGPYDMWAIEYGYTLENDTKPILARVAEPELQYLSDEDTFGPDPLARRYDLAADPLQYVKSRMKLAGYHRERLLDKFVKDGDSWSKARRGYTLTLGLQTNGLSTMARWVGAAYVNHDRKGDPNARPPIVVVDAGKQRDALKWIIENSFYDASFGLTPDLLNRMTVDKWWDAGGDAMGDPTWPIHDRIMGIQSAVLTMLMNPQRAMLVFDNEARVPAGQDALTLPEVLDTITAAAWTELDAKVDKKYTARDPMISSLRLNLQREFMERLIDLSMDDAFNAAYKPVSTLATAKLRELKDRIGKSLERSDSNIDPYSRAHLSEAKLRIEKALDAQYIRNASAFGGSGGYYYVGQPAAAAAAPAPAPAPTYTPEPAAAPQIAAMEPAK